MRLMQFKKRTRTFIAVLFAVIFAFCEAIPANAAEITLEKVSAINAVPSGSSVTVTWSETSGAQGYEVQRRFDTTGTYETIGITSDCAYTDNNLALNTVYYYRVRPFASDESGVVYAPYCSGKYVKTDYLEKVVTFEALAEKNGNILSWQEVCDADGYILYSVDSAGNLTKLTQTSALTYTDTSVSEGNIYRYCMRAYKIVEGNYKFGGYSDIVSVTASTFDPLTSPTIISADASGSKVTVAWETVEGANGYILQRKTDINGIYEKIADVTTPYFEDVGLDLNTVYYYRVCAYAVDSDGSIVYSSYCSGKYVKTTYLETVAGLQGSALANGIQLQWDAVYGADGYIIYYINADDSLTKAGQTASVTFTDYSVIAGEVYKYCVRAYTILDGSYKFGGYSVPVEITMPSLETYYDVTRFGADGTDSSPDNDAIQTALNMALKLDDTQKLTVYIPAGTYYLDKSLTIYSNTTLSLDEACTLIRNDASQLMLTAGDKSGQNGGEYTRFTDITIEGGTWDGNASADSGTKGIIYLFHGENLTLSNFTIKNCCGGHHIELAGIKNATISDVVFRDFIYSEENDDSDNSQNSWSSAEALQIDFCSAETAGGSQPYDNTACADITIERCSFINVLNGVGNHHGDAVSKNITIQGSIFENIANSCINLDATDVFLIADNTASNVNGFLYALSSKGIVRSNVVRGCTDGTASDGNMLTVGLFSSGTAEAPLPEIQIQNNTFTQAGAAAIRLKKGVTATIENNVIEEPKTVGIYLDTTDSVTLNGNTVTGSGEIGIYVKDISMLNIVSNEVNASGVSNILIDNSTATLTENLLENALGNGIAIINSSKVSMERNSISGNGKSGISAKASELTLNGDFIFANKEYGIYLDGALSGTEVAACEISKNTLAGVVCTSGVLSISTCKIFENSGDGIWLFSGGNAEITDCNIFSNSGNGVNIESSSTSHVENCNITDNFKNGVSVSSASSNIYNNFIIRNGIDDSYYDILYKTGSSGAAENNVTGKKAIYKYSTASDVTLLNNKITIAFDYPVSGIEALYFYENKAICPTVLIEGLKEGTDYTVSYEDNNSPGTATILITGIGDYTGEIRITFEILDSTLPKLNLESVFRDGNILHLQWDEFSDYDGYRIMKKNENELYEVIAYNTANSWEETVAYGTPCTYRIQGYVYNEGVRQYGAYSNEITVTATLSSSTISILSIGQKDITLTWEEIAGANGYEIQRKETLNGTYQTISCVTDSLSLNDTQLKANTVYYYRVRAYAANPDGSLYYGAYCAGKYVKTDYLAQVKNLRTESSKNSILLTWDAVEGATGYLIYDASDTSAKIAMTSGTSYTDTTLSVGESRSYTVRAYCIVNGSYKFGGFAEAVVGNIPKLELTVPVITNSSVAGSTITICWSTVDDAEGYLVQRKETLSGNYETVANVTGTSFTDKNLKLNTVYYYRVCAYSGANTSQYTAGKYTMTNYLEQVKNLKAESSKSGILLTWDAVEGATGYLIYDASDTSAKIAMTSGTSYTDTTLSVGESRSYTVRAYYILNGSYKFGGFAEAVVGNIPKLELTVPVITNSSVAGSTITICWSTVDDAEGYLVQRKETLSGNYETVANVTGTSFTDRNLKLNTVYYYRVCAYSGANTSQYTAGKYTMTNYLEQVKNLKAESSKSDILLTWDAVEGATGYLIYDASDTSAKIAMTSGTSYTDTTLAVGESRSYTVRAYYILNGSYKFGGFAEAVVGNIPKLELTVPVITNSSVAGSTITICWSTVDDAEGYLVQRKETLSGNYETVANVTGTSFTDKNLKLNTVYYYRVCAYSGANTSQYTAGKYTMTNYLEQVKNLKAESSKNGILLTWDAVEGATGYLIYDASDTSAKIAMTSGTSYTDTTLAAGESRSYTVRAYYIVNGAYKFGGFADAVIGTAEYETAQNILKNMCFANIINSFLRFTFAALTR